VTETTSLLTVKMQPSSNWKTIVKSICGAVFTLSVVSFPPLALALDVKDVPNPQQNQGGRVSDMAKVLSPETEADINRLLSKLESTNSSEIAVVTVPETSPSTTPKEFATTLFNYWGIGKKGRDNGVLFLISTGDRRVEIETGYGVEGILPDALVGKIITEKITPQLKQGNYDLGTLNGTQALIKVLESGASNSNSQSLSPNLESKLDDSNPQKLGSSEQKSQNNDWGTFWLWVLGLGGGTIAIFGVSRNSRRSPQVVEPIGKLCSTCQQPMAKIDSISLQTHLSKPQQVAQELGSVDFAGWHCTNCSSLQHSLQEIHLERHRLPSSRFRYCLVCKEFTLIHTSKILEPATVSSEGTSLEVDSCHCCSYQKETEQTIKKLPLPSRSSSSSTWINSSGSDWSGGGGGYSGGGGDWGGGSSGGGGAGGGW
jgi:uncharacterized protein